MISKPVHRNIQLKQHNKKEKRNRYISAVSEIEALIDMEVTIQPAAPQGI